MKILQIHNEYLEPGGEDTISAAEARLLQRGGHEVVPLRVKNPRSAPAAAWALAQAPYNLTQRRAVTRLAGEVRPDVAHVHNTWYALTPAVFSALHDSDAPTVMTLQNFRLVCAEAKLFRAGGTCTDCVGGAPWHAVQHGCYRGSRLASIPAAATIALNRRLGTWDHIDVLLAPSNAVRAVFLEAGFDPARIIVRPNFVEDPGPRASPPSASTKVLYVGRLSPEKGLDTVLDSWQQADLGDLELVVIGDGPAGSELRAGAGGRVRFTGHLPPEQVTAQLLTARALVFPSRWPENFGRSIIEAMAAGTPALVSDIGTPGELVAALGDTWLARPDDRVSWIDALHRLRDDSHVDTAGRQARALFEQRFSPEPGLRSLEAAYATAINRRRAASPATGR